MQFSFWGEEQHDPLFGAPGKRRGLQSIYGYMYLFGNQIAGKMFLCGDHIARQPEEPNLFEEGIDHFVDGLFETHVQDHIVEYLVEHVLVEVDGGLCQLVDEYLRSIPSSGKGEDQLIELFCIQPGDRGDLVTMVIEEGDAEHAFQVIAIINPVIARLSPGAEDLVALLPDTQGMGLDAAHILDIPYGKSVHRLKTNGFPGIYPDLKFRGCNISFCPATYGVKIFRVDELSFIFDRKSKHCLPVFLGNHKKTKECRLISCWF